MSINAGMGNSVFEIQIVPPEWVALGGLPPAPAPKGASKKGGPPPKGGPVITSGPLSEWQKVVGTGPWMLTNFVTGNSMTLKRNPDYWGNDERHPENRLPYADELKVLLIPDNTTAMAA